VLLNDGFGNLRGPTNYSLVVPESVAAGDVNHDGNIDLVTATNSAASVSVLLGNGLGVFGSAQQYATGGGTNDVVLADFNNDGNLDVATVASVYGMTVLPGKGNGTFSPPIHSSMGWGFGVAAADFNGDGWIDAAAGNYSSVSVLLNTQDWRLFDASGFPSATTAGEAHLLTVTALDSFGNVMTGYTGTVHFGSSDPRAVLPADYTFNATDAGVHAF